MAPPGWGTQGISLKKKDLRSCFEFKTSDGLWLLVVSREGRSGSQVVSSGLPEKDFTIAVNTVIQELNTRDGVFEWN